MLASREVMLAVGEVVLAKVVMLAETMAQGGRRGIQHTAPFCT